MKLYEGQLEAVDRMSNGCILCGNVGTGKTITSLSYYYLVSGGSRNTLTGNPYEKIPGTPLDLYVITTAHVRDTGDWEKQLAWFHMSPNNNIYKNKVVVDSWNNIKKYENVENSFFIFDEQRVVGWGAWSKAFVKIARRNKWILLSATPGDTWSDYIPVFIANGFYKNKTEFTREHIIYSRFTDYPQIDRYINTGRLIRLRNKLLVDMNDVRHTNEHHEQIICSYNPIDYKRLFKDRWNIWEDKPIETASELCMSLRRIVNSDESRQLKLLELIEKHPKAIIFYNFNYELDILKNLAYGEDVAIAEWNGHAHQPIPETDKWVYLVQYTAGCEGWNCIKTDTIIFFSQNYSYKVMQQAAGRINRMNTPFVDLYYYHLRSNASIDVAIKKALNNKKKFNESRYLKGVM